MRIITLTLLILLSGTLWAQKGKKKSPQKDSFLDTQWFLGFYGGINVSAATPSNAFFGYAPLNYEINEIEKTYDDYSIIGGQYGLIFKYYFLGFTISLKPGFNLYGFQHNTSTRWVDSNNSDNTLQVSYNHTTKLNYLEFPLTFQYDLQLIQASPQLKLPHSVQLLASDREYCGNHGNLNPCRHIIRSPPSPVCWLPGRRASTCKSISFRSPKLSHPA